MPAISNPSLQRTAKKLRFLSAAELKRSAMYWCRLLLTSECLHLSDFRVVAIPRYAEAVGAVPLVVHDQDAQGVVGGAPALRGRLLWVGWGAADGKVLNH